jgi:hypothetical protein
MQLHLTRPVLASTAIYPVTTPSPSKYTAAYIMSNKDFISTTSVGGLVVKSIVAKDHRLIICFDGPRVRFPADAFIFASESFFLLIE